MIAEFGVLALTASLCFALLLVVVPTVGIYRHDLQLAYTAKYYAIAQWVCAGLAFLLLMLCFLNDDFSVLYVRMNSSVKLPWFYKACAVWGGHEGSMLLWVCILQTWTLAVACCSQSLDAVLRARVLVVLGALSVGFLIFILGTSNPFLSAFEVLATEGRDLNPLLQDPGFLFHPPMLYMGYVGFAVAFAGAVAMLWAGKFEKTLIDWARPWTMLAWCCLTLGITLGSWWAYRELGWGGFWFWDPVENASFMPWLVGTALIHSQLVASKRHSLIAWCLLLSILCFALSLIGTFLVRSGVLNSVHAFAVDPLRGLYILGFLMVVVGGSLLLFSLRSRNVAGKVEVLFLSREMALLLNNVFLVVIMLTVLLGTLYPLLIDALGLGKLSVGAPYFNLVFVPLGLPLLGLMGIGLGLSWREEPLNQVWKRLKWPLCMIVVLFLMVQFGMQAALTTGLGIVFSAWVLITTFQYAASKRLKYFASWGVILAHLGVAVTALGITVSTGLGKQEDVVMKVNESIEFAGYKMSLLGESNIAGPNYHGIRAELLVEGTRNKTKLYPEKRMYDVGHVVMTDAAMDVNVFRDLYVALGEPLKNGGWSVRLYYKPLVRWIWAGGLLMCLGGALTLCRIKRRKLD